MSMLVETSVDNTSLQRYRPRSLITPSRRGPKRKYDPLDVLQKLADGDSLQMIARQHAVRPSSMRTTLHGLMVTHKVSTIIQLVAHYLRNGWID